jgi:hypothetical protein
MLKGGGKPTCGCALTNTATNSVGDLLVSIADITS